MSNDYKNIFQNNHAGLFGNDVGSTPVALRFKEDQLLDEFRSGSTRGFSVEVVDEDGRASNIYN